MSIIYQIPSETVVILQRVSLYIPLALHAAELYPRFYSECAGDEEGGRRNEEEGGSSNIYLVT